MKKKKVNAVPEMGFPITGNGTITGNGSASSRKTLDWGGKGGKGGKGGAMRAQQKWLWHDSIFSCDRR